MALRVKINDMWLPSLYELLGKKNPSFLQILNWVDILLWLPRRWHHPPPTTVVIWIHLGLSMLWWPQQGQPQAAAAAVVAAGETAAASASAASISDLVPCIIGCVHLTSYRESHFQVANRTSVLATEMKTTANWTFVCRSNGSGWFSWGLSRIPMENG